jgi:sulfhydrogenase subunit gamma (sulfur reductase)
MTQSATTTKDFSPDVFLPKMAKILEIKEMTAREKFFRVELPAPLGHRPGQFVMVSVLGVGEAPISISCGPRSDNILEMLIRNVGSVTQVLHAMKPGQSLGIRGPFGSGFKIEDFYGKDLLFVCGGLGLAPLRSLITPVVAHPEKFGKITILSGCRSPAEELYRDEVKSWAKISGVEVIRLVDGTNNMPWDGDVGLVTAPIPKLTIDVSKTFAVLCGPPVMYKFVIMELDGRKLSHSQIFVDLERRMKCGVGKCGHSQINHLYCCQEGPVFRFSDIEHLPEALL